MTLLGAKRSSIRGSDKELYGTTHAAMTPARFACSVLDGWTRALLPAGGLLRGDAAIVPFTLPPLCSIFVLIPKRGKPDGGANDFRY
jgi:hypothetical protein